MRQSHRFHGGPKFRPIMREFITINIFFLLRLPPPLNALQNSKTNPHSSTPKPIEMLFFKSSSGAVHQESQPPEEVERAGAGSAPCISLTVWRKSLLLTCNGFTVIDRNGNIVYRVDNYTGRPEEMILMDGLGKSILTMCRSKVSQQFSLTKLRS